MQKIGTDQYGADILLLSESIAVISSGENKGLVLYYDDLGHLHNTHLECLAETYSNKAEILSQIVDLRNIVVDGYFIDLYNETIDNEPFETSEDNSIIRYKGYSFNVLTNELTGEIQELNSDFTMECKEPSEETKNRLVALLKAIVRADISGFCTEKELQNIEECVVQD